MMIKSNKSFTLRSPIASIKWWNTCIQKEQLFKYYRDFWIKTWCPSGWDDDEPCFFWGGPGGPFITP